MIRVGIDVGGTNTDAVVMDGTRVVAWAKTTTTPDATAGLVAAASEALARSGIDAHLIRAVMVGTTRFTNAIIERRDLAPTAVVRLGLPATLSVPPLYDWPADLRTAIDAWTCVIGGGHEFDGREIAALDERELHKIGRRLRKDGYRAVAVVGVFSPVAERHEERAAAILCQAHPEISCSLSREIGRLGLLERENATALNACLVDLASSFIDGLITALRQMRIAAPLYVTQNDGTLMAADEARRYPVRTFSSGPTNSMRGAAFLSGLRDGIVIDVGGTTTDVGAIVRSLPREAGVAVYVGGVRTNFRMPDVLSIGLGGGSVVEGEAVGPRSVGYRLATESRVFGGATLTASDVAVAGGRAVMGDGARVTGLDAGVVARTLARIDDMATEAIDRVRTSAEPVPVIAVGGGSVLLPPALAVASRIVRPEHYEVANAVGAAIAEVSGEVDRVFMLAEGRDAILRRARDDATARAIDAGADPTRVEIAEVDEVPLTYLPSNASRVRVKAIGALREDA